MQETAIKLADNELAQIREMENIAEDLTLTPLWVPVDQMWTVNGGNSMHWRKRGRLVKTARKAGRIYAKQAKIPAYEWAIIRAKPIQSQRGGQIADVGGHYPVIKAVVDGLVDAGVFTNDTPDIVRDIRQSPPIRGKTTGIALALIGITK